MGNLVFQATLGGQVNLVGPNTASTYNINVPAVAGTMVTTGDTGSVSSTMLASSLSLTTPNIGVASGTSLAVTAGLYSSGAYSGTYTDGIVVDYTTGMGRISVGTSDGLTIYNGGVASSPLVTVTSSGNVGIGTISPTEKLTVSSNAIVGQSTASGYATINFIDSSSNSARYASIRKNYDSPFDLRIRASNSGSTAPIIFETSNATEAMRIDSSGTVTLASGSGLSISATTVTSPASTDGNVFSGTYTPTQVSTNTNVAAVTYSACQYMRVGNTVTVSGAITIDPTTAATQTQVFFSLPIASNFGSSRQLGGTGLSTTVVNYATQAFSMIAEATNDCVEVRLNPASASAVAYAFSFTYQVI